MLSAFSFRKLKINPPAKSPSITKRNKRGENHSTIIATWYRLNADALNMYASFLLESCFRLVKTNPRKKNSSKKEFAKDMYKLTYRKFSFVTPALEVSAPAICEKSKNGDTRKYPPSITT